MSSLSLQDKKNYIEIIHSLWTGTDYYTADDVTEEVAEIVDKVIQETIHATRAIRLTLHISIEAINVLARKNPLAMLDEMKNAWQRVETTLKENHRYKFVLDTAVLKYKSLLEITLMGL